MQLHNASLVHPPPATYPFPLHRSPTVAPFLFFSKPARLNSLRAAAETSFYELLGIPVTGTLPEIKQAYKQMARKYHPDVSPPGWVEEHTRRFILVQQAYETLSDPAARAIYDRDLAGNRTPFTQERRDRSEWRSKWQEQVRELKRRSKQRDKDDAGGDKSSSSSSSSSWGVRMRRHRTQISPIVGSPLCSYSPYYS